MPTSALISDIHANLEALEAVLADIESQSADRIVCLGDIVGYGPDPVACMETIDRYAFILCGNHELALFQGAERFNERARKAIEWTDSVLQERRDLYQEAISLPAFKKEDGILYVHGSPCDPTNEYLLPKLGRRPLLLEPQFARLERYAFCGHTHLPGVFEPGEAFQPTAEMFQGLYLLDDEGKGIINVGSVGQPRDHDPRACYCIFDGDSVRYRRVEYDVEATVAKIHANPALDNFLGDRLLEGK